MASDTQPSVIKIALVGWRDALRAITRMMPVAGPAFLFTLMSQAAYQLSRGYSFAADVAIFPLHWILQSLVLTPLAIAVHRYVLLDEVTRHYALNLTDQRFRRFFGLTVGIQLLWLSIGTWLILGHFVFGTPIFLNNSMTPGADSPSAWGVVVCFAAVVVTGFIVGSKILSIVILFPAIAVDAPGVGWRNAMDDSKGHIYRIFWAFGLGLVPTFPLDGVAELIFGPEKFGSSPGPLSALQAIGVVLRATESILIVSAFAAIASRFYVAFGRRLDRAAPVA